jgi:hypothetical protein
MLLAFELLITDRPLDPLTVGAIPMNIPGSFAKVVGAKPRVSSGERVP